MWSCIQGVPVPDQCEAIYKEYQYQINVQGYKLFEVDNGMLKWLCTFNNLQTTFVQHLDNVYKEDDISLSHTPNNTAPTNGDNVSVW
jgi:hypothetical protein